MTIIADILLALGAFGVAIYCLVLSSRLKKFTTLESGMGSAIAVLSAQVDDMTKALEKARGTATTSAAGLEALTLRAEGVAGRIELLIASMHDLPQSAPQHSETSQEEMDADRKLRFVRRRAGGRGIQEMEAAE